MKTFRLLSCCLCMVVGLTSMAFAQATTARHGIGPMAGLSINPDQFVVGGQAIFGPHGSPIHFVPAVDFGFGDNVTVITLNFDVTYDFTLSRPQVVPYLGAGFTAGFFSPDGGDNQTEAGLTLLGGLKLPAGRSNMVNIQGRVGIGDIPDFKLMVGYIFQIRSF